MAKLEVVLAAERVASLVGQPALIGERRAQFGVCGRPVGFLHRHASDAEDGRHGKQGDKYDKQ